MVAQSFPFTFENLRGYYQAALREGYEVVSCHDYALKRSADAVAAKTLVNRVDIDVSPRKARRLVQLFAELDIRATFFIRLHANEYNPFSFENYRCLKAIPDAGHEIGLHSEVIDQAAIWEEPAERVLRRDLEVLRAMFDAPIYGVASHGGMTGLNNLDFWKDRAPEDFGLLYEAYDESPRFGLFRRSFYLSDSSWTYWKCYDQGSLRAGDHRTPDVHFRDAHALIYLLIHPETYYDEHPYE